MQDLQLFEVLMNGAQASVVRGLFKSNDRLIPVAVKVYQDPRDREIEEATLREISDIPGVVKLVDCKYKGGLVLELLQQDLFEFTSQYDHALPLAQVQQIGKQVLTALAQVHDRGLTHYDIKPENIMVCKSELVRTISDPLQIAITGKVSNISMSCTDVKLIDFAFADREPQVCGTQTYYPPELLANQSGVIRQFGHMPHKLFQITAKVDVWATACVMFEMYTSVRIFDQSNDTRRFAAITSLTQSMEELTGSSELNANTIQQVNNYTLQHLSKGKDLKLRTRLTNTMNLLKNRVPVFFDFLSCALQYNPANRWSAKQLLQHPFIQEASHLPMHRELAIVSNRCGVCGGALKKQIKVPYVCSPCQQHLVEESKTFISQPVSSNTAAVFDEVQMV